MNRALIEYSLGRYTHILFFSTRRSLRRKPKEVQLVYPRSTYSFLQPRIRACRTAFR